MNNRKILFVFNEGRKNKIDSLNLYAKDFFYYYFEFKNDNYVVDFIEVDSAKISSKLNPRFIVERLARKITNLPFYGSKLLTKENKQKLLEADLIIFTNETTIYSSYFFLINNKKKLKATKAAFIMGLTENSKRSLKHLLIKSIFKNLEIVNFLSKNELNYASKEYSNFAYKFNFTPFVVDNNFWSFKENNSNVNNRILFIGNDRNRDYSFVTELVSSLPDFDFTIISNNKIFNNFYTKNSVVMKGDWRSSLLTDLELRDVYHKSSICILPLKNTIQPSGQSVALQAMSTGIPVLITKTDGFWDDECFIDNKNILLFESNDLIVWKNRIKQLTNNTKEYNQIISEAQHALQNKYDLRKNYESIKKILDV
jgi:glycosyltransferase involved in cell wall biosynthesis